MKFFFIFRICLWPLNHRHIYGMMTIFSLSYSFHLILLNKAHPGISHFNLLFKKWDFSIYMLRCCSLFILKCLQLILSALSHSTIVVVVVVGRLLRDQFQRNSFYRRWLFIVSSTTIWYTKPVCLRVCCFSVKEHATSSSYMKISDIVGLCHKKVLLLPLLLSSLSLVGWWL